MEDYTQPFPFTLANLARRASTLLPMFGESGTILLEDSKSKVLKPYNSENVRILEREAALLNIEMSKIKETAKETGINEELSLNYLVLKKYEERNERMKKAYLFNRALKMQKAYFNKQKIEHLISNEEKGHFYEYKAFLDKYFSEYPYLDFFEDSPPLDLFVHVYTLQDCGVVLDGTEFIEMKKNRLYFLRKRVVRHLILNDYVKVIR
jgi:hypothetical protein